jgi:tetratricopeptide (TPR) repeat protein
VSARRKTTERTTPGRDAGSLRRQASHWGYGLLILAAGLLAYSNSFQGVFLFDDDNAITGNPHIRALWPPGVSLSAPPQSTAAGRPLVSLSLALNYAAGGLNPWGYHLFNLVVHLSAGLILFGVVRRTLLSDRLRERYGPSASLLAGITALSWVVHPLQTESVTYVIQRTESLMGLFYLLTLYCAIRSRTPGRPLRWQIMAIMACGLGMATKEVMATAPLAVVLHDAVFGARSMRGALKGRPLLYGGLAGTWIILAALMASGPRSDSVGFTHGVTAFQYALNQCEAVVGYLRLCLWPHPLVLDYGSPRELQISEVAPYAVVLALLLAATVVGLVRRPALGFCGAWFFLILGPTSSVVPITTEVAAERRMYLPLAGVLVLVVLAVHAVSQALMGARPTVARLRRSLAGGVTLIAVCVLVLLSIRRNAQFHDEEAMWRSTLALQPNNARVLVNLGRSLASQGRFDAAMDYYRQSLEKDPKFALAHYNMANALQRKGQAAASLAEYQTAIQLAPDYEDAHVNLGVALVDLGRYDEAIAHYFHVLAELKDVNESRVHCNLAVALAKSGRPEEAVAHFRESLQTDPVDDVLARHNLAGLLLERGRLREAAEEFRILLRINPQDQTARAGLSRAMSQPTDAAEK